MGEKRESVNQVDMMGMLDGKLTEKPEQSSPDFPLNPIRNTFDRPLIMQIERLSEMDRYCQRYIGSTSVQGCRSRCDRS